MRFRQILIAATLLAATALPSWAATYYVAPTGASLSGTPDGTKARPWPTVRDALKRAKGGDTVLLMDGKYDRIIISGAFESDVTIQSQTDRNAQLESILFEAPAKHIRLTNVRVWRDEDSSSQAPVKADDGTSYLTFENLEVRSRKDADNYLKWSKKRWLDVGGAGFGLGGNNHTVRNSSIKGVRIGIVVGPGSLVEYNTVDGFSGDGMKGVSNSTFRYNTIMNRVKVDDYHSDGFQAYSKKPIENLILDSNIIIEWTHNPSHPLRGWLQGIGLFDGWYDNLTITNNIVATRHWHGISVYGTRGAKIINNTVVNLTGKAGKGPWIKVYNRKDGSRSENVIVANNLAMSLGGANPEKNVIFDSNSTIIDPAKVFESIATFDYRPKASSGFIDSAKAMYAPKVDVLNHKRPYAKGPDKGALEVGSK